MGSVQELCIRQFSPQYHPRLLRRCSHLVALAAHGLHSAVAMMMISAIGCVRYLCLFGDRGLHQLLGGIDNLTKLQFLDLSGNELQQLPDCIGNLTSLPL